MSAWDLRPGFSCSPGNAVSTVMPGHPAPECAETLELTDERVPAAARSLARAADGAGWQYLVTYARGASLVGKACEPGPVVETVALRLRKGNARGVATWDARLRAECESCGKSLMPLASGVFRAHVGTDGESCPGGGAPARMLGATGPEKRAWAFSCAYVAESGWWNVTMPLSVNATEFAKRIKSG